MARLPGGPALTMEEHVRLTALLTDLNAALERGREAYTRAGGEEDFAWAHRNAIAALQGDRVFRVPLPETPGGVIAPGAWALVNARDSAMADNALWALAREGEGGRVLVFAHNAHVMNAPITGGIWDAFERPPNSMGQSLRAALGEALFILGTSSAGNGAGLPPATADEGGVDAALARLGHPRFLINLRAAPGDRGAADWLAQRRGLRANFTTSLTVAPGTAFDALFFVDTLTAAHPAATTSP